MPTLPRQRLVGFDDYKQKEWDVNAVKQYKEGTKIPPPHTRPTPRGAYCKSRQE